jgi:CHAT domain-containing protein
MALIGDPVFNPLDERLRALPALANRPSGLINRSGVGYRRLPFAQEEIQHIQSLMPRESVLVRTGFDANRAFILRGGLQGFDFLHIASHGLIDPEDGGRAALVLSLYDRKGNRIDGFLRARDIDTLDLSFRLVVLSACETGLGEELRGEGQVGLAQSFLAAGADDVVASLWSVPDDRTFELMSGFYRRLLRDGLSPAQALRQAQIAGWKDPDYRSPYYWAGFMIQGRGGTGPPGF